MKNTIVIDFFNSFEKVKQSINNIGKMLSESDRIHADYCYLIAFGSFPPDVRQQLIDDFIKHTRERQKLKETERRIRSIVNKHKSGATFEELQAEFEEMKFKENFSEDLKKFYIYVDHDRIELI